MKTPKEKAEDLIKDFNKICTNSEYLSKQCGIICVEEIIDAIDWHDFETPNKELEYWQEVKQEIEKF